MSLLTALIVKNSQIFAEIYFKSFFVCVAAGAQPSARILSRKSFGNLLGNSVVLVFINNRASSFCLWWNVSKSLMSMIVVKPIALFISEKNINVHFDYAFFSFSLFSLIVWKRVYNSKQPT